MSHVMANSQLRNRIETAAASGARSQLGPDDPFLAPVETPKGLGMKFAYFFSRRKFGKVIMPLKVHSAVCRFGSASSTRRYQALTRSF
jgi:hypothetical protein